MNQNSERQGQDKHLHKNQVTPLLFTLILPYPVTIKRQDVVYTDAYLQLLYYCRPYKTQIKAA